MIDFLASNRFRVHFILFIIILTSVGSLSGVYLSVRHTCTTSIGSTCTRSTRNKFSCGVTKNNFCLEMKMQLDHDSMKEKCTEKAGNHLKYVHESIRKILDADPEDVQFCLEDDCDSREKKNKNMMFVNEDDCLIQWDIFEEHIGIKDINNENENGPIDSIDSRPFVTMEDLLTLASQCEKALYREHTVQVPSDIPQSIHGLIDMSGAMDRSAAEEKILIVSLLSLNMVESSIRDLAGKRHGRAPLLKDMIQLIAEDECLPASLPPMLRSLLLPNQGVNLRNLLWHGFVPGIKRHWFALSIVLILSMDDIATRNNVASSSHTEHSSEVEEDNNLDGLHAMRAHPTLVQILDHGESIISSSLNMKRLDEKLMTSSFIPDTHKTLAQVSLKYVHSPIIFASVAGPLIEHALRLWWCDINDRPQDAIARPGSYYVTLDGHGQRDKHDIVLLPYLSMIGVVEPPDADIVESDDSRMIRNKLVDKIGKSTMDLLVDLFASPPGSPNIRASVAHGLFNGHLENELSISNEDRRNDISGQYIIHPKQQLHDMTCALITVLDLLASIEMSDHKRENTENNHVALPLKNYRPIFSYSAKLLREIDNVVHVLSPLYAMIIENKHQMFQTTEPSQSELQRNVSKALKPFATELETLKASRARIFRACNQDTSHDEYSINIIASDCGAVSLLFAEISSAAQTYVDQIVNAIEELESSEERPSSRRRKQINRLLSVAQVHLDFYSFTAFCALLFVERRVVPISELEYPGLKEDELFLAVKRSRMVVSTFSTAKMMDRALKAVDNYSKGKAVKAIAKAISDGRHHKSQ